MNIYCKYVITLSDVNVLHRPSPCVHFKLPQDTTINTSSINQRSDSSVPEKSPCISPIQCEDNATDVPKVQMSGLRKEKHVVVNLPSVWSDCSSSSIHV